MKTHLWLWRWSVCTTTMLLCAGVAAAADLESAKRSYQQEDFAAAFKELTPLAGEGDPDAQLILGKMYLRGQGVLKDPDQAIRWLEASAAQGNADAQLYLGSLYLLPHKDIAQGLKWMRLSAEQGNQDAQLLLGKACLEDLPGVPRDAAQAEMWLWLAAKDNLPFYKSELASSERQMTTDQVLKGRALAAAWKPKPGLKPEAQPQSDDKSRPVGKPRY